MKMAMTGVFVGIVAAAGLTRLMSQLIYGVSAADPATFAGVIITSGDLVTFLAVPLE